MLNPATQRLLNAFAVAGVEARFVGGCVRDALLGRNVNDVDIVTPALPEQVICLLEAANIKAIPTGIEHGTVTAVVDGKPFEITTLRRDIETDGRRAKVAFTNNWAEDAARRDFTMNAMSCTSDGQLFDFFGGVEDARAGRVRFIGDPEQRIAEDVLRILRFFRFHAHYGQGTPDAAGLKACAAMASYLHSLSGERVRTEILKLLNAPDPASIWKNMVESGIVEPLLPVATHTKRLSALVLLENALDRPDPLRRLAALIPTDSALPVAERLRLSAKERERLAALTQTFEGLLHADIRSLKYAVRRLGHATVVDRLLLEAAENNTSGGKLRPVLDTVRTLNIPPFPLQGRDALDLGLAPGPHIGKLLSEVEEWWEAADYTPDREACLKELARRAVV